MNNSQTRRDLAHAHSHPTRRKALVAALVLPGAGALTANLAGCQNGPSAGRPLVLGSLRAAEEELLRLVAASSLASTAQWTWAQTLEHGAQSIEYSMRGFPQPKSQLFQSTVGAAAFAVFNWRGQMTHDLTEPIPGAPSVVAAAAAPAAAVARLRAAMEDFRRWSKPLQPHFAYGALDKAQYERAHAMHLANHWTQFQAA